MSNLAYARPVAPARPGPGPHIEIVTTRAQRRTRPRAAYAVVTVASLFLIFAAQLLLSIVVSQGAYQIDSLQSQEKGLLRTQEALNEQFNLLDSTQHLAQNAASLGMVPNGSPRFLDLATGAVAGAPGTVDPTGCGGNCGLVANSLLTGVPLTTQAAPKTQTASTGSTAGTPPSETTVDTLPAPVTH
ncbi:MAG: hypothetical protein ABI632_03820 [Pseudolysinimonas sp.]